MFKVFLIFNMAFSTGFKQKRKGIMIKDMEFIDAVASGRFIMLCVVPGARDRG